MDIKKNEYYLVTITDLGSDGEGIGKIDNFTVFVENAVIGDYIKIKVLKVKKSYCYGKIVEIIKPSEKRVVPECKYFYKCGGCSLQHLNYESQLEFKTKKVNDNIKRIGGFDNISVCEVIGSDTLYNYRNKAQYPVGKDEKEITIGFYSKRSHHIINIEDCLIQNPVNKSIVDQIKELMYENNIQPYDEITHTGLIRHILIRTGYVTKEIMVCIVINGEKFKYKNKLIEKLSSIENIVSITINKNTKKTNVILGESIELVYGKPYITDYIENLKFQISPLSFYQVNPIQVKNLYNEAVKLCSLSGNEIIIDAYCGIGTISLFLSQKAKKVYGIEIVEQAIDDAVINAGINNIENAEFIAGKSEEIIPYLYYEKNISADIIVVDPPRKGCEKKLLEVIKEMSPKKVVYISCDSATLARDLKILCDNKYEIKNVKIFDVFIFTPHIETIVLLELK